jgi:hypothetical protein
MAAAPGSQAMRSTVGIALVTLGLLASSAHAQQEAANVRLLSIKATVLPQDAKPPTLPEALEPWAELLSKIPGFETSQKKFEYLGSTTKPTPPATTQEFSLPCELQATVATERRPDGKLDVTMELTRPGRPPKKPEERERVLVHEVTAEDGATYVVRVQDAFAKGEHLLVLVTPSTKPSDD